MNDAPPDTGPALAPRLALGSIAAFWTFYLAINTLRAFLSDAPAQLDMLGRRLIVTCFGVGLTWLLYLFLRRRERLATTRLVGMVFLASIPLSLTYASFNWLVFYTIHPNALVMAEIARHPPKVSPPLLVIDQAVEWYAFIVAWGILYLALANAGRVREAERNASRYRAAAQSAELRALRYQVNPHFLFNTLNSLSALVLAGRNRDAEAMILNLARFFRTTLASDPSGDVPLGDEIAMQRLYLAIEQVRFPDRLKAEFDIPEALNDAAVPGLILQPLIENAIKHGVARSRRPVTITVRARASAGRLALHVEDDGEGLPGAAPGTGTGVRNVCDRLAARFGDAARCTGAVRAGGGYEVELAMPLHLG